MTIKFIADYYPYKIGNTVSLTSAEETALVNQKVAVTDLTGGSPYIPDAPNTLSSVVREVLSKSQVQAGATGVFGVTDEKRVTFTDGKTQRIDNNNALYNFGVLENFSNILNWSLTASTPASANIAQVSGFSEIGNASFNVTTAIASGINAMINQDRTFNLNTKGGVWVLWENNYLVSGTTQGVTLYLSHSTGFAAGVGRVRAAGRLNEQSFGKTSEFIANGDFSTLDGTPNFANDWLSWRWLVSSATQDSRDYNLDGVIYPSSKSKAKILFTLDDNTDTGYSIGHAEAFKRAIPLTHYIIASAVDTASHSTTAQLNEMKSRGDYIGVHGFIEWASDISVLEGDIERLRTQGIADLEHGAWPNGLIGTGTEPESVISSAKAIGLKSIRKTSAAGNGCFLPAYQEMGCLPAKPLSSSMSLVNAKGFVDKCITSGGTLIFYGHKFGATADATTWVTADWQALLDYVAQKRNDGLCDCITIKQMYQEVESLI